MLIRVIFESDLDKKINRSSGHTDAQIHTIQLKLSQSDTILLKIYKILSIIGLEWIGQLFFGNTLSRYKSRMVRSLRSKKPRGSIWDVSNNLEINGHHWLVSHLSNKEIQHRIRQIYESKSFKH